MNLKTALEKKYQIVEETPLHFVVFHKSKNKSYMVRKTKITSRSTEFEVFCPTHNYSFKSTIIRFIEKENVCANCAKEIGASKRKKKKFIEFEKRFKKSFPNWKLLTSENEYLKADKYLKIKMVCPNGHKVNHKSKNELDKYLKHEKELNCNKCDIEDSHRKFHELGFTYHKKDGHKIHWKQRRPAYSVTCNFCNKKQRLAITEINKGCPNCNNYFNFHEEYCRQFIGFVTGLNFPNTLKVDGLINPETGKSLTLDGYNLTYKLAFEYQGRQHSDSNHSFRTETTEDYDKLKAQLCKEAKIELIHIDRKKREESMEDFHLRIVKKMEKTRFLNFIKRDHKSFKFNDNILPLSLLEQWNEIKNVINSNKGQLLQEYYCGISYGYDVICENGHKFKYIHYDQNKINRKFFCWDCGKSEKAIGNMKQKMKKMELSFLGQGPSAADYHYQKKYLVKCKHGSQKKLSHQNIDVKWKREMPYMDKCFHCQYEKSTSKEKLKRTLVETLNIIKNNGLNPVGTLKSRRDPLKWKCISCSKIIEPRSLRSIEIAIKSKRKLCKCQK